VDSLTRRVDGLESYGSSGIVEPSGAVLGIARQLEPDLVIANILIRPVRTGQSRSNIRNGAAAQPR
jgi:hypothetical protein